MYEVCQLNVLGNLYNQWQLFQGWQTLGTSDGDLTA